MTSALPAVQVQYPVPTPSVGMGLYASAALIDAPRGVTGGVEIEVPRLGGHGLWDQTCTPVADNTEKHGGDTPAVRRFPGTGVWAADDCGPVGASEADARRSAEQTLRRTEPADAERFLAPHLLQDAVPAATLAQAITMFTVEGLVPVVHIAPSMLEALVERRAVSQQGSLWRHVLGGVLAVGAGYEGLLTAPVVTGPTAVYRSAVHVASAFGTGTNQRLAVAERSIAVAWVGPTVEVTP